MGLEKKTFITSNEAKNLAQKRKVRGSTNKPMKYSREYLREEYCKILEEYLDLVDRSHWGKTLEWKMRNFETEAIEALEEWAIRFNLTLFFPNLLEQELYYKDSLYFVFLRTLDYNT